MCKALFSVTMKFCSIFLLLVLGFPSIVAVFPPRPSKAKITVLQMDMDTLDNGKEINDSIVEFFL